jgi:hypothetical protein
MIIHLVPFSLHHFLIHERIIIIRNISPHKLTEKYKYSNSHCESPFGFKRFPIDILLAVSSGGGVVMSMDRFLLGGLEFDSLEGNFLSLSGVMMGYMGNDG